MIPNRIQQEHLADFAPKQSLDKYSKGADPRVISGIIALDEMKQQAAMRERANLANGAASGQMPTVRDKIMALFQQSNPQQAQMQPNPLQQGIMAQARPQMRPAPMPDAEAPFEAYSGGVARLPVSDDMFGYAGGGIIAFNSRGSVPEADDGLTKEEAEAIRRRIKQRTDMNPEKMDVTDLDFTSLPQLEKSDLRQKALDAIPKEEPESEVMRAVKTPFRALKEGIKSLYRSAPGTEAAPIGEADQNLGSEIMKVAGPAKPPAERKQVLDSGAASAARANFAQTDPRRVGIASNLPGGEEKTTSVTRPPKVAVPGGTTKEAAPEQDQESKLMDMMMKQFGPQAAVKTPEERLAARDKYVAEAPTAPEALALIKHYDNMAKRYAANDEAEKAQQAVNARNNLWSFLSNTRGSSLGVAAGRADAALQPLLATQETRRQNYQKQRDEQEMLLGKSRYEIASAERARKEGRYSDAEKHEAEAQKLQEQARGHNIQGLGSLINAAGVREQRRLDREQQYQMHKERMAELSQRRAEMQAQANETKSQAEFTRRESTYGKLSEKVRDRIAKAEALLNLPNIPKDTKASAEAALARAKQEDNDLYERIVLRGDSSKDYRPGKGGDSALTSKADKIVGIGAK